LHQSVVRFFGLDFPKDQCQHPFACVLFSVVILFDNLFDYLVASSMLLLR